jgi:hypothetical protein
LFGGSNLEKKIRRKSMSKVGILTFHYSNNYGGVLQALSLQKVLVSMGYDVEVINFVPASYRPTIIMDKLGFRRNIFKNKAKDLNLINIIKKINIMKKYNNTITEKFNSFRKKEMKLSKQVDENSLETILNDYETIIVGSDQVWNPSQRKKPEYFLNFGNSFKGKKVSYAADSTISEIDMEDIDNLRKFLNDFSFISVRNEHSFCFVKSITNKEATIVADPTILYDFQDYNIKKEKNEDYILTYILGKEIEGTHSKALEKIKKKYGELPVYSIKIPTMNFELSDFADKLFYDLDPVEWLNMFRNAKFIYTDSFHGVLFSLKYHKPFLAYYTEKIRATRFIDLGKRYNIEKYIVQNVEEIDEKGSIDIKPKFKMIDNLLEKHKQYSLEFLKKAL